MNLMFVLFFLAGLVILYSILKVLLFPARIIFKLIVNGILGAITLFLINFIIEFFSFNIHQIPIEPLNALVVGILGVPGVIILLIIQSL